MGKRMGNRRKTVPATPNLAFEWIDGRVGSNRSEQPVPIFLPLVLKKTANADINGSANDRLVLGVAWGWEGTVRDNIQAFITVCDLCGISRTSNGKKIIVVEAPLWAWWDHLDNVGETQRYHIDYTWVVVDNPQEKKWPNHWPLRYPTLNSCLLRQRIGHLHSIGSSRQIWPDPLDNFFTQTKWLNLIRTNG